MSYEEEMKKTGMFCQKKKRYKGTIMLCVCIESAAVVNVSMGWKCFHGLKA